jgi:hypothetical protein
LSESAIAELAKLGFVVPASVTNLGRTVTGVVVREGASQPDISTPEAFKQALLKARSVAYTDPKAGGSGGIMFSALLQRLGIADEINKKAFLGKGGHDVAKSIVEGRAELGTTFISEVLPMKGTKVVGRYRANCIMPTRIPEQFTPAQFYVTAPRPCCTSWSDRRPALVGSLPAWSRRSRTADLLHGRTALPN